MKFRAFHRLLTGWLFYCLLLGCNNASNESSTTLTNDVLHKSKPLDNFELSPGADEYGEWEDEKVGANPTENKKTVVNKINNLLVFHADDTMEIKKVYIATLALARNAALDPIKEIVLNSSEASDDKILVDTNIEMGKRMKSQLLDISARNDPSFIIKPMGYDEQNMNKTKHSLWQWSIEPLKEGPHKLMLSVQVILSDDDGVNLPARNIPVMIFSKKVSFFTKVEDFLGKYWQWIVTAILLPVFIAWFTHSLKQRNEQKNKPKV